MNGESNTGSGIRVRLFGRTDVGQIREHNEDNFLVADLTRKSRSLMEIDREQRVRSVDGVVLRGVDRSQRIPGKHLRARGAPGQKKQYQ